MGDERRQSVVVAVADLVGRDGVVLVDDRHGAELEEAGQRAPGVKVLPAVDEVLWHEQRLGRHELVRRERIVPAAHQPGLPGGRDRLQRADVGRSLVEPEGRDTRRDGARRHDDHLVAAGPNRGDLGAELFDRGLRDHTPFVGERRRPDLDDDAHAQSSRYSKLNVPIQMTSPSLAPALVSSLLTPSRSSR